MPLDKLVYFYLTTYEKKQKNAKIINNQTAKTIFIFCHMRRFVLLKKNAFLRPYSFLTNVI
jgi:hypothetical protein